MKNTKSFKKIIEGITFTFTRTRTIHFGFDNQKHISYRWLYLADNDTSCGAHGASRSYIRETIPYQIKGYSPKISEVA